MRLFCSKGERLADAFDVSDVRDVAGRTRRRREIWHEGDFLSAAFHHQHHAPTESGLVPRQKPVSMDL